jgi:hypothetical protein
LCFIDPKYNIHAPVNAGDLINFVMTNNFYSLVYCEHHKPVEIQKGVACFLTVMAVSACMLLV